MLAEGKVFATVAVSDMAHAKEFYSHTLGLRQVDENPGGTTYESGGGRLFIYEAATAGSGKATCASWAVDDVVGAVEELKAKGITFEQFDLPGATWEGDVAVAGAMKAAWFKDPDGNVLAVGSA